MIDYPTLFYSLLIGIFGIFAITEDIKKRKVSNQLNLTFLTISILIFILNYKKHTIYTYLFVLIIFLASYFIYHYEHWGGADGKIFISLSLLLISFDSSILMLNFIINIFIFYSLTIIILVISKTSLKTKIKVLKRLDYLTNSIILLAIFAIMKIYGYIYDVSSADFIHLAISYSITILIIGIVSTIVKKGHDKLSFKTKLIINLISFLILLIISQKQFILYFLSLFIFKIFLDFMSSAVDEIRVKNKKYNSPFSIYLIISAIFTILVKKNILKIIILFFS